MSSTSGTSRPHSKTPRRPAKVPDSMFYYLHLPEAVHSPLQDGICTPTEADQPATSYKRRAPQRPAGGYDITAVLGHRLHAWPPSPRPRQALTSSRRPRPPPLRPLPRLAPRFRLTPTRAGFHAPFDPAPSCRWRCRARRAGPCWMRTASCTSLMGGRGACQLRVHTSNDARVPGGLDGVVEGRGVGGGCGDCRGDGGRRFLGVCAF